MATIAERRDYRVGGSGGKHEPYQTWGREADSPEMQRLRQQAGAFGGQYNQALGQQQGVFQDYATMAGGGGPSMAQGQLQAGINAANAAATQGALQARGGNAAGAQMASTTAATQLGGQAAVAAAQMKQAEMLAAMQAQAGMANQMAGQGLQGQMGMEGMYQQNLGTQLQGDIDYRLGSRGLREQERSGHNQRIRGNIGTGTLGVAGDSSAGVLSDERAKTNVEPANANAIQAANPYANYNNPAAGEAGGIIGGNLGKIIGLAGLLSDERVKRNIAPGNLSASQAVGALDPYTFEYESGLGQPSGRQIGVMAQDLEKVAPQAVDVGPDGLKRIDTAQATGLTLAASADTAQRQQSQEQRLRELEQMLLAGAGPQRSYDATQGTFQGTDGRVASNASRDSYSLGGMRGAYG